MSFFNVKKVESCNLMDPISSYIGKAYGSHQLDSVRHFLQQTQDLRNHISSIKGVMSNSSLHSYRRYLYLLHIISRNFTFGLARETIKVKFKWTDTLSKKEKLISGSIQFEICCVIYNITMIKACDVFSLTPSTVEEFKTCLKDVQEVISLLAYIKDVICPSFPTESEDLGPTWLNLLYNITIAKASEIVYNSALVKGTTNSSLLSKLAQQAAENFLLAHTISQNSNNDTIQKLNQIARINNLAFLAAAQYQRVQAELFDVRSKSNGFGRLVGRLRLAVQHCNEANSILHTSSEAIKNAVNLTHLLSSLYTLKDELDEDNRKVYMEVVPSLHTLVDLEGVNTFNIKHLELEDIYEVTEGVSSTFASLIPSSMRSAIGTFSEQLNIKKSEIDSLSSTLVRTNSSPASSPYPQIINSIWNSIQNTQKKLGIDMDAKAIRSNISHLHTQLQMCKSSLDTTLELLNDTHTHTPNYKRDEALATTKKLLTHLKTGESANNSIEANFKIISESLHILNGTYDDLVTHTNNLIGIHTHTLQRSPSYYEKLTKLKNKTQAIDFVQKYSEAKLSGQQPISVFSNIIKEIQNEFDEIKNLENLEYSATNVGDSQSHKDILTQFNKKISENLANFDTLTSHIQFGITFYSNMNDKLDKLSKDVQSILNSM